MPDQRPLRIIYIHRTNGRGAEGVHISSIVREWRHAGHDVRVLSPPGIDPMASPGDRPVDKSDVRVRGVAHAWRFASTRLPQGFFEVLEIGYNLYSIVQILSAWVVFRPDLFYERYAFFHVSPALLSRLLHLPMLLEVNEVSGVKRARGQKFLRLCGAMERFVFRSARAVFPVSSFLAGRICEVRRGGEKILVVPNAVEEGILDRPTHRDIIRRRYGFENCVVAGFAGWFDEWDRLDILMDAVERVEVPYDLVALIVGDGPARKRLEETARAGRKRRAVFTGPVPRSEIFDYLDAIDIPVFPHSNVFGSPVVLFEFMALGKGVVAPKLLPFQDVISHGVNGILFDVADLDDLTHAIATLAADRELREAIGVAAKRRVRELHTWGRNARSILQFAGFGS